MMRLQPVFFSNSGVEILRTGIYIIYSPKCVYLNPNDSCFGKDLTHILEDLTHEMVLVNPPEKRSNVGVERK